MPVPRCAAGSSWQHCAPDVGYTRRQSHPWVRVSVRNGKQLSKQLQAHEQVSQIPNSLKPNTSNNPRCYYQRLPRRGPPLSPLPDQGPLRPRPSLQPPVLTARQVDPLHVMLGRSITQS